MSEEDKNIMKMLLEDKNCRYNVIVDNDCIYVYDFKTEEIIHTFETYGQALIVELFNYIGIDAEEC